MTSRKLVEHLIGKTVVLPFLSAFLQASLDSSASALPSGVRRGLCPAVRVHCDRGYAPGAGFAPSYLH